MNDLGAVIVCGGQSKRMKRCKASLPFGNETLLERTARQLSTVAEPLVVVAAHGQRLPPLPAEVTIVRDPIPAQGPLQGLAVGLSTLAPHARYAFVSSTDAPFMVAAFVTRMRQLCEGYDAAVARIDGYLQPLAAVYATSVHDVATRLVHAGERRPRRLFDQVRTHVVEREVLVDDVLRAADPELWSTRNLNTPEDYAAALRDADLER